MAEITSRRPMPGESAGEQGSDSKGAEPTKACSTCRKTKPLSAYYARGGAEGGLRARCRACVNAAFRDRYSSDPDMVAQIRARKLESRYGISVERYDALLALQGDRCALCRSDDPGGRWESFHVDHCHETGRVRGLLCHKCNVALGSLGDTVESVVAALEYVTGLSGHGEAA